MIVAFVGANLAIRLLISPNLEWDESEFVGRIGFSLGYPGSHPPLYNWIVGVFYALTDSWSIAVAAPKHLLLAGTYLLVFDLVRRLTGRNLPGAMAAAALILVPEIVFFSEYTRIFSVLALFASAACLHAIVMVVKYPGMLRFIWLGLAVGIGFLAKYNFIVLVAALLLAAMTIPIIRRAVLVPKLFLSMGIVMAMVVPHGVWALRNMELVTERMQKLERVPRGFAWFDVPGIGLDRLVTLGLSLMAWGGLLAFVWVLACRIAARSEAPRSTSDAVTSSFTRLFGLTLVIGIGLLAVIVLAADIHNVRMRYVTPVLVAFPVWLVLRWPIEASPVAARRFLSTAASVALFVTVAWPIAAMALTTPFNFPFRNMASAIEAAVEPPFAIWSKDREVSPNLVMWLDDATVWDARHPADRVLLVWGRPDRVPKKLIDALTPNYRSIGDVDTATFPALGLSDTPRTLSWQIYERDPAIVTRAGKS